MNPGGGKSYEGIKAEWYGGEWPVVGENSQRDEWLKVAGRVNMGGVSFWKGKFKGHEEGKNLCVAIIVLLAVSTPEIPNPKSPLIPFFPDLYLGTTQGHCPFGPMETPVVAGFFHEPSEVCSV